MATFPILIVHFFLKINRVEGIDEIDKLSKFHQNPTKNDNFYCINKKKTNGWMDDGNHAMT